MDRSCTSRFPRDFWKVRGVEHFLSSSSIWATLPSLLLPPSNFPLFCLGPCCFFHYCFLNSKNIDGRSELCFPGGGLGFLCPFELLGAQQFPSQVRSGQPGLILKSGFVESDRAPALSKLTAASLWCEMRVGFTWRIFGGGGALSSFICLSKPFQNTCNSGIGAGGECDFGGYACDPRFFMVVFQTTLVVIKRSLYPPGIFNIVLQEKFFFRSITSILLMPPSPKQLGYANPC